MPWKAVKRNCKQANGRKGSYVVVKKKSKGRTEQESCHTSKDKAAAAVRVRYASKNELSVPIEENIMKLTRRKLRMLILEEVERTQIQKLEDLLTSDEINNFYMGANLLKTLVSYDEMSNMMGDHPDPMLLNALENAVTYYKKKIKESRALSRQMAKQEFQLKKEYEYIKKVRKIATLDKKPTESDIISQVKKSLHPLPSREELKEMMQSITKDLQELAARQWAEADRWSDYYQRLQALSSLGYDGDIESIWLEEPGMYGGIKFGPAKDNYVYLDDPLMEVRI